MKTGSVLVRLIAGVPVVAGFCLMQGCATSGNSGKETPAAVSNIPPESVTAPTPLTGTNAVKEMPATPLKEKAVLKPVPSLTTPYTAKAGETVSEISEKFGKRWQDVLAVNPELKKESKLKAGHMVQLPNPVDLAHPKAVAHKAPAKKVEAKKPAAPVDAKKTDAAAPKADAAAAPASSDGSYTVAKGDTIATIAAKHHV